jgi:hypothetical protein
MAWAVIRHGEQGHHQGEQTNQAADQGCRQGQTLTILGPLEGDPWGHAAFVGGQVVWIGRIANWGLWRGLGLGWPSLEIVLVGPGVSNGNLGKGRRGADWFNRASPKRRLRGSGRGSESMERGKGQVPQRCRRGERPEWDVAEQPAKGLGRPERIDIQSWTIQSTSAFNRL